MHTPRLMFVVGTLMLTAACSEPKSVGVVADSGAAVVIEQARAAYVLAQQKQHAWTMTGELIEAADKALAQNDEGQALVAAKRALFTANASLVQADKEQQAWRSRVPQ